jgi:hypothetical protein
MRKRFLVVLGTMLLLCACNSGAATPQPSDTPTPIVRFENVHTEREPFTTNSVPLENCNGTDKVTQNVSRTQTVTVDTEYGASGELSGGIKGVLDAKLQAQFNVKNGESKEFKQEYSIPVDAGKRVAYEIRWYETWQVGDAVIDNLNLRVPFRVRTGLEGELGSGAPQSCQSANVPTTAATDTPVPPTAMPQPSATPVPPTSTPQPSATPAPSQSPTEISVLPSPSKPTLVPPTFTAVAKAYPCDATIISPGNTATLLNIVRLKPQQTADLQAPIQAKTHVRIFESTADSFSNRWYRIHDLQGSRLGWIPSEYAALASNCPS